MALSTDRGLPQPGLFIPIVGNVPVRLANQGLWPERLRPASFIFIAPPAAIGLSALRFGLPPLVVWGL